MRNVSPSCQTLLQQTLGGKISNLSLHYVAHFFLVLDKRAEANAAAKDALERNSGRVIENCHHSPNFKACFMCQGAMVTEPLGLAHHSISFGPTTPPGELMFLVLVPPIPRLRLAPVQSVPKSPHQCSTPIGTLSAWTGIPSCYSYLSGPHFPTKLSSMDRLTPARLLRSPPGIST